MKLTDEQKEQFRDAVDWSSGWAHIEYANLIEAEVLRLNGITGDGRGEARKEQPVPYSGADENPPVFGRRWSLHPDGFGLKRDDLDGNLVHIDDALSVLHEWQQEAERKAIAFTNAAASALAVPHGSTPPQQQQAAPVPDGFVLVPAVPDWNMQMKGIKEMDGCTNGELECFGERLLDELRSRVYRTYRAMIAAAPKVG